MKLKNKILPIVSVALILAICFSFQVKKENTKTGAIKLIVRADDMASFHAANIACIKVYKEGIARSVEIMVPCAWFPEAVKLLSENPKYDVGVHLVLTSEWDNVKWRPISHVPSLVDKDGYFYPIIWKDKKSTPHTSLLESKWKIEEIEQELKAQIDLAKRYLPHISHLSAHMGCSGMDKTVNLLIRKLAKEYNLQLEDDFGLIGLNGYSNTTSTNDKIEEFIKKINLLTPGNWVYIDHPGQEGAEMQMVKNGLDFNLGKDRQAVTDIWTSQKVKDALHKKGVELVSYKDLINNK